MVAGVSGTVLAIVVPVWLAMHLARRQAVEAELDHAAAYATEVVRRSDSVAAQVYSAIERMRALGGDPCGVPSLRLMRQIDLTSAYIEAVGFVVGDRIVCSSFGGQSDTVSIGAVQLLVSASGGRLRSGVELRFAPGVQFIVIERDGFAAVVNRETPVDVTRDSTVAVATFTPDNGEIRASRGTIRRDWLDRTVVAEHPTRFVDEDAVVAIVRSRLYSTAAVAAVPLARVSSRSASVALIVIPAGIVAGLLLGFTVIRIGKQERTVPRAIRTALEQREFHVAYLPFVQLDTGACIGAIAELEWRRGGEIVAHQPLFEVADDSDMLRRVREEMIGRICADASAVFARHEAFQLYIRLPHTAMEIGSLPPLVTRLARETSAGSGNLVIDISEQALSRAAEADGVVRALHEARARVAISHFGSALSSVDRLEALGVDLLTIDAQVLDAAPPEEPAVLTLARVLRLEVYAGGVDTRAQLEVLRERGVRYGSGRIFGGPSRLADLIVRSTGSAG